MPFRKESTNRAVPARLWLRSAAKNRLCESRPSSRHGLSGRFLLPRRTLHPSSSRGDILRCHKSGRPEAQTPPRSIHSRAAAGDYVSPKCFRTAIPNPKLQAEILIRFCLEEGDLAFVTLLVAEEPVPGDPFSGQALNFRHFDDYVVIGLPLVVTKVIVPRRNEQMKYLKLDAKHAPRIVRADLLVKSDKSGRNPFAATGEGA